MNDGDEKNTITFDDVATTLYFTRLHPTKGTQQIRIVPLTACAWIELYDMAPAVTLSPEVVAASKADPKAFQKL